MPSKFFNWLVLGVVALFATLAAPAGGNGGEGSGQGDDGDGGGDGDEIDLNALPEPVRKLIEKLDGKLRKANAESKERRLALEEAARRDQAGLAEKGEWKTLAERLQAKVAVLEPYQTQAEEYAAVIAESNQRRIEQIHPDMRVIIPELSPQALARWLDRSWAMLTTKPAPQTDAGAGSSGGRGVAVELTAEEKAMAQAAGMTFEEYAKYKIKK